MSRANLPWPPLISAAHAPRWIRWRDALLTSLMWLLFAAMLETEFELFFGEHLKRLGFGDFHTEPNWPAFFERLTPFLRTAAVLVLLLAVAGLMSLRLYRRSFLFPQPAPLEATTQARRAGMDEAALIDARELTIAVVHVDADGKHRVEALAPLMERGTDCKSVNS
jgi:hypothetical protein